MIEPEEAVSLLGGTESEEGMVRHELTCIVEARALKLFVRAMLQPPVHTTLFKYLDFKDISNLRQAILYCHATTELRGILLYDGLIRVIPYSINLCHLLEPFRAEVQRWLISDEDNDSWKAMTRRGYKPNPGRELRVIHLLSYSRKRVKLLDPLPEGQAFEGVDPEYRNFCRMGGELDDNTFFHLCFINSSRSDFRNLGCVVFAPTYKSLLTRLTPMVPLNFLASFVNQLNTSHELKKLIKEASAEKASTVLQGAIEIKPGKKSG
ncbi:hypothetical protein [Candidatus Sororendozoicomonas aggregata]|uniref:hypothetical protein n=1 Tax=Candidatus Sororendozoicomonas aggregata TaxID=3073239 RepID=UPI002ED05463